jgi:hypothetical protein
MKTPVKEIYFQLGNLELNIKIKPILPGDVPGSDRFRVCPQGDRIDPSMKLFQDQESDFSDVSQFKDRLSAPKNSHSFRSRLKSIMRKLRVSY